jgi:hypothetical protein
VTDEEKPGAKARLAGRRRLVRQVEELEARVVALETQVQAYEGAHVRFAELVDVVTELLVPMAQQDQEKVRAAVARYTAELDQES